MRCRTCRTLSAFAVLAGVLLGAVLVLAASVVDDFNTGDQQVCVGGPTSFCTQYSIASANSATATSALGNERDIRLTSYAGPDANQVALRANAGSSGVLEMSQDSGASALAEVTWDGADGDPAALATTLLSVDLTNGGVDDAFEFVTTFNDLPIGVEIVVYCNATDASSATLTLPGGILTSTRFVVPFSDFVTKSGAGCPPANTGSTPAVAVQLLIDGSVSPGADLNIDTFGTTTTQRDYGDAPDTYSTTSASGGPAHVTDGLTLGSAVDTESDGNPVTSPSDADGDDLTGIDDEDGVRPTPGINWNSSSGGSVEVTVNGCGATCYLSGWIDWNQDGDFADAQEQIFNDQAVSDGVTDLVFQVPSTTDPRNNSYYARFRICRAQNECNTIGGEATSGEVEDYLFNFGPTAVTLTAFQGGVVDQGPTPLLWAGLLAGALAVAGVALVVGRRLT